MDLKEEIFRITRKEESLETYMERFHYNLQRSKFGDLAPEILKTIFLRGMRDHCLEHLNLLGKGDISQESFEEIMKLCLRSSRGSTKGRSSVRDPPVQIQKSTSGVTRATIGNLFEDFKIPRLPRHKLRKHKEKPKWLWQYSVLGAERNICKENANWIALACAISVS